MNPKIILIANQMMKGPNRGRYSAGSTIETRSEYLNAHLSLIEAYLSIGPKRSSAAVGAVICKCALKYGQEIAFSFAKTIVDTTFNGSDDPALLLWTYLQRKGRPTIEVYQIAVTAARAFCEGRKLKTLAPARTDI